LVALVITIIQLLSDASRRSDEHLKFGPSK